MIPELPTQKQPEWLSDIGGGDREFRLRNILSESLFYPACGLNGTPIKYLAGNVHSFVYADYMVTKNEYIRNINGTDADSGCSGYHTVLQREIFQDDIARPVEFASQTVLVRAWPVHGCESVDVRPRPEGARPRRFQEQPINSLEVVRCLRGSHLEVRQPIRHERRPGIADALGKTSRLAQLPVGLLWKPALHLVIGSPFQELLHSLSSFLVCHRFRPLVDRPECGPADFVVTQQTGRKLAFGRLWRQSTCQRGHGAQPAPAQYNSGGRGRFSDLAHRGTERKMWIRISEMDLLGLTEATCGPWYERAYLLAIQRHYALSRLETTASRLQACAELLDRVANGQLPKTPAEQQEFRRISIDAMSLAADTLKLIKTYGEDVDRRAA